MTTTEQETIRNLRRRYRDKYGQLLTLSPERLLSAHNQVRADDPDFILDVLHELQNHIPPEAEQ